MRRQSAILLLVTALNVGYKAYAQAVDTAKHVYEDAQNSVFLIYLNDASGQPEALGSAFVVAPRTLITNAHVVEQGTPVLAVGPVRIPVRVVARDSDNDLAVLSVDVDLTSKSLPLDSQAATPGERIFAIGNPEGLEKTISEGLVSGIRQLDNRTLLQITSPISHGSSGGPILNTDGQVIGVAVGMLEDGQNLNFAVPVKYVREILSHKSETASVSAHATIDRVSSLAKRLGDDVYSQDDSSPYQEDVLALKSAATDLLKNTVSTEDLKSLTCMGVDQWTILDQGIEAARKLYQLKRTPENGALLSFALLKHAESDDLSAEFAKDGSSEKSQALNARSADLAELIKLAAPGSSEAKSSAGALFMYTLAGARNMLGDYSAAMSLNEEVLAHLPNACGVSFKEGIYRDLIFESSKLGRSADAEKWFRRYASEYTPTAWEWDSEADRLDSAKDFTKAADANERAANGSKYLEIDFCWAAQEHFAHTPSEDDQLLNDGRKCIDASVKSTSDEDAKKFNERLPAVYRLMSTVLEQRGVHQTALQYIKEALAVQPNDPRALYQEAMIFQGMERYSECISVAQSAINASDGKFAWMHFGLGNCYFDTENWSQAASSFKIAATGDKDDPASAYNLGLCYLNLGFKSDAKVWLNEALKRSPTNQLREKILNALRGL